MNVSLSLYFFKASSLKFCKTLLDYFKNCQGLKSKMNIICFFVQHVDEEWMGGGMPLVKFNFNV